MPETSGGSPSTSSIYTVITTSATAFTYTMTTSSKSQPIISPMLTSPIVQSTNSQPTPSRYQIRPDELLSNSPYMTPTYSTQNDFTEESADIPLEEILVEWQQIRSKKVPKRPREREESNPNSI